MKLKTVVFLMTLSLSCPFAHGNEQSHRVAAEELLLQTDADQMLKTMWDEMRAMMKQQFVQKDAREEFRPIVDRYSSTLIDLMEEEFSWANMKDDYVDVYVKTYTEEELSEISEFYKSPAGRKYTEKMPQLVHEMMEVSQKNMPSLMEKMTELSEKMVREIELFEKQENE